MRHEAFVLDAENSGGWRVKYMDRACLSFVIILECAIWYNEIKGRYMHVCVYIVPRALCLVLLI